MPKVIVCDHDEKLLECTSSHSDRFVYSNYFVPVRLTYGDDAGKALITKYQKKLFLSYYAMAPDLVRKLDIGELLEANGLTEPEPERGDDHPRPKEDFGEREGWREIREEVEDARGLLELIDADGGEGRELRRMLERRFDRIDRSATAVREAASKVAVGSASSAIVARRPPSETPEEEQLDLLLNLLKSEIGYVFLDRTRIRPAGFAMGEHLYSLSLAPGEEVVIEQKTFTKRSTTFEEQTEHERQIDIELASTLSTELQDGFERQKSLSATKGLTIGGNLGGSYGVQGGINISHADNVTDASTATRRHSVKESSTASQKVASKYRAAHKIDFKVSAESGFEQSSKRTIRNPNRFTSLHLEYFKMLQRLDLSQERYGARLCWAPCIKDPGFDYVERLRKGREAILKRAEQGITLPTKPTPPTKQSKPPIWVPSGQVEADKWGLTNDMSADYDITVTAPDGYVWDGDMERVRSSLALNVQNVNRSYGAYVVGDPWQEGADVKVKVHVGVDWVIGKRGSIFMTVGANFVPNPGSEDAEYQKAWGAYEQALATWQTGVDAALADVRAKATEEADAWEASVRDQFNPIAELMGRVITHSFPPAVRDECWEIDLWQTLFDWDEASWAAYPSWWSDGPMRDWSKDPADFINASWAKLYIPIKVGAEKQALRWIFDKLIEKQSDAKKEKAYGKLVADLNAYREATFGHASETNLTEDGDCPTYEEKYLCMGRWTEVMPTDGTHVEVVQGMTSAKDEATGAEVTATSDLQAAILASHKEDVEIKKKAREKITNASVDITIDTHGHGDG